MNILWINILGVSLIAFIVWWFWLSKSKQEADKGSDKESEEKSHH